MDNFKRIRNPMNPHTYIYISQKEIDKDEVIEELKEENKKLKETIFRKEERINELDNFVTRKDREIKSNWSDLHRLRMEQRTSSEENRNLSDQVDQLLDVIKGKEEAIKELINEKYAISKSLEVSEGIRKSQVTKIKEKTNKNIYLREENRKLKETIFRKEDMIGDQINIIKDKDEVIKCLERTIEDICETHNKWVLSIIKS